jgi:hypothetical protein
VTAFDHKLSRLNWQAQNLMEQWPTGLTVAQTHPWQQTALRKMQTMLKVVIVVCSLWFHAAIL